MNQQNDSAALPAARTTTPSPWTSMSRRGLFGMALGVSATGLLAACGSGGGANDSVKKATAFQAPSYVPATTVPGAIVSKVPGMPPTFTGFPASYFSSVPTAPGGGSDVTSFQILWGAPPQSLDKNKYWQQLNKNLAINFKPTLVSSDNYNDKMATTIASGNIPDLVFIQDTTAVGAQAIGDGVFADLSDVLAGDKILEWPNLANIDPNAWKASQKNGHIFGIPNENSYLSNFPVIRQDAMAASGHPDMPASADEFKAMLTDMAQLGTVSGKKFWPIGGLTADIIGMTQWMFRAGTGWQLKDGKLINVIETDGFEQSLTYLNDLWQSNVFHPDALALGTQKEKNSGMFTEGTLGLHIDSTNGFFGAKILTKLAAGTPGAAPAFLVPPGFDGGDITVPRDAGYWGMVGISAEAAKDEARLKTLLGVANYWRSPFGSKESLFINSGIEGVNFTFADDHSLVPTGDDQADVDRAGIQYLGVFNSPTTRIPTEAKKYTANYQTQAEKLTAATVADPTVGLFSDTNISAGTKLGQLSLNYQNGIISGRMPLSDLAKYREDWRKSGGDAIRSEFQQQLDKGTK
ncbi:extracellular solute-binding protein [Specibacter sp. AOP5-B1-6]|uniref:extracellular solute-binding protein n=1 Tax=Specibacter sp. AOP5-B1-6 TaxID=3457653 RepID=UPI00402B6EC0